MTFYALVTAGEGNFALAFCGQTKEEIEAMLQTAYPGCTWEFVDGIAYTAFVEAHRPNDIIKCGKADQI